MRSYNGIPLTREQDDAASCQFLYVRNIMPYREAESRFSDEEIDEYLKKYTRYNLNREKYREESVPLLILCDKDAIVQRGYRLRAIRKEVPVFEFRLEKLLERFKGIRLDSNASLDEALNEKRMFGLGIDERHHEAYLTRPFDHEAHCAFKHRYYFFSTEENRESFRSEVLAYLGDRVSEEVRINQIICRFSVEDSCLNPDPQ